MFAHSGSCYQSDGVRTTSLRNLSLMEREQKFWVVAIGASGSEGLEDIKELLAALPPTLAAVVLVVLHRLWDHPTQLRTVLARASRLPVVIAAQGERFEAGTVYIGEPAEHLTLAANSFSDLIDDPERHYGGRTVDLLFKSVAAWAGTRMIGVVLSGSLDDGSRGLAAIHAAGGITMVLTPAHEREKGMPENAISFDGPIDLIGGPQRIAEGICAACEPQKS
jgi:two-component system, chemotaxis family, protein-glutamate methylesterase/glutaminase